MITMTRRALAVIRKVTANPRLDPNSGLRIAKTNQKSTQLQVRTATGPSAGDEVIERHGARIFLGPGAVWRVQGRLLDAVTERGGRVHFVLMDAPR
jgi:Fe-S cluster assembly iron-binding protein IscA